MSRKCRLLHAQAIILVIILAPRPVPNSYRSLRECLFKKNHLHYMQTHNMTIGATINAITNRVHVSLMVAPIHRIANALLEMRRACDCKINP